MNHLFVLHFFVFLSIVMHGRIWQLCNSHTRTTFLNFYISILSGQVIWFRLHYSILASFVSCDYKSFSFYNGDFLFFYFFVCGCTYMSLLYSKRYYAIFGNTWMSSIIPKEKTSKKQGETNLSFIYLMLLQ